MRRYLDKVLRRFAGGSEGKGLAKFCLLEDEAVVGGRFSGARCK